jgi:hypothetical protein
MTDRESFEADPRRASLAETGIYVRAKRDGRWQVVDIAHLTRESLEAWIDSRPNIARNVVLHLLGHPRS